MEFLTFDIETDTTVNGLDPNVSAVTTAGFYDGKNSFVVDDVDEHLTIGLVDAYLTSKAHDRSDELVIVSWNGCSFDWPFVASRAAAIDLWFGGLLLEPAADRPPKYEPLPGHEGGYRVSVKGCPHVDIAYPFEAWCAENGVKWSLKPVADAIGVPGVVVDRENVSSLGGVERAVYNLSDAVLTYEVLRFGMDNGVIDDITALFD